MIGKTRQSTDLPLAVVGVDFRRASARRRGGLLLEHDERSELLQALRRSGVADGLACLDTCNRTEWIASTPQPAWTAEVLRSQMIGRDTVAGAGALTPYVLVGADAARHLFEVAAGLESFVMGEQEISKQLQRALERSRSERAGSPVLNGVGMVVGHLTRDTHRIDLAGSGPRGVHDLAVAHLGDHVSDPRRVVVVGLGQIGRKVVRALRGVGYRPLLCNRTTDVSWAEGEQVHGLDALPALLERAESMVVCTAAPRPVVTPALTGARQNARPLLLVDLGIPAQIDPRVAAQDAVELADLEVLQAAHKRSSSACWADVVEVRRRVERGVREFELFCRQRSCTRLLQGAQQRHEHYVKVEIPRFLETVAPQLDAGHRSALERKLKGMLRSYTNGIFHDIRELVA